MIKILLHDFPPKLYGYAEHDLNTGIYWVFVASNICPLHQRFTFGHELAHVLLHHHDITDYLTDRNSAEYHSCEAEANRRAWEFYRKYRDAFYQLQQTGRATISI